MRLDVVVAAADKIGKMREAAGHRTDIQVRFFEAPRNVNYMLPFPFVMFESDDKVVRTYGEEAEKLFYEVLSPR